MVSDFGPLEMGMALRRPYQPAVGAYLAATTWQTDHRDDPGIPPQTEDLLKAYRTIINVLGERMPGQLDAVAADASRILGRMNGEEVRKAASNDMSVAQGMVTQMIGQDPVLARLLRDTVKTGLGDSFYDGQLRSPFDRMTAPGGVAGFYSGTTSYAGLSGATYDSSKGVSSLSADNFSSSPFAGTGLTAADIPFIRALAADGFSTTNIVNAARDAAALGFSPRDRGTVRDFAVLDRVDPSGRADRNAAYAKYAEWVRQNKEQIKSLQDAVDNAKSEEERKAAIAARDKFIKGGQDQTGVTAVGDRIDAAPTPPGMKPGEGRGAHDDIIGKITQKQAGLRAEIGNDAAMGQDDAAAAAVRGAETGIKARNDEAAKTLTVTSADASDDFGVTPVAVAAADTVAGAKPVAVADASAVPPKDGPKDAEKGEEAPADPKKKPATQVAAVKGPSVG